jgi:transcriptional regulator with XRE-family HTH domain
MLQEADDEETRSKDDEQFRKALGLRIRAARDAVQMKQETAAVEVGVATATFSRWEKGHFAPNLQKLCRLAEVLGVSLDSLCGSSRQHSPQCAIVDVDRMQLLVTAAAQQQSFKSTPSLLQPPSVGVAFVVPRNMQIVPPDQVPSLMHRIDALVSKISP